VSEDEGDTFLPAEISEPVAREDALNGNNDILAEGSDDLEEMLRADT
jgi:hypothetical protein